MAESSIFKAWAHLQAASIRSGKSVEEIVETWMEAKHLKVEARTPLGWEVWEDDGKPEIDPALCRRCQRGPFVTSYHGVAITNAERLCYNCLDWDYHQDYMRSPG